MLEAMAGEFLFLMRFPLAVFHEASLMSRYAWP